MMPQESFIFSDNIYTNICLYRTYPEGKIADCLEKSGLTTLIQNLHDGVQTEIAEDGNNLSGGQIQRISLARTYLKPHQVLLIDEMTASLDVKTTNELMKAVLSDEGTLIAITHDIYGGYMQLFDKIYYMEDGCILEQGNFSELMDRKGKFFNMLTTNQGSY